MDLVEKVRVEGLEPPCREALDPKSSVSTNFTTPASIKNSVDKDTFFQSTKKQNEFFFHFLYNVD